jgi:tetratricopeptide (TPR) repeat protein
MKEGDLSTAIIEFRGSNASFPHAKTCELMGECLLQQGAISEAIVSLAGAVGLGNRPARASFLLAKAFAQAEEYEEAVHFLRLALSWNPDYKSARQLLETIERGKGDPVDDSARLW